MRSEKGFSDTFILYNQPISRGWGTGRLHIHEKFTIKKIRVSILILHSSPTPKQPRRWRMWLIIAFLKPFNPSTPVVQVQSIFFLKSTARCEEAMSRVAKNMTLVLGSGCVTQAALVLSHVPLRGKADEDSGSNPGCAMLRL